ncbi:MAG TPA: ABC transporter ATP-binding protein [candidate division Zixibacteria bacterium]|nr:ABC transporter ATP-binding protein [candidate division Zixibacteria bacterium]
MNSPEAIRCERLSRTYGKVEALKDLNLSVEQGSVFGFLGRNGAGKTTTIRLLTGLAQPTSGRAWVNGLESTSRDTTAQSSFGYMPEVPAFYPWMTSQEFLLFIGRLFGLNSEQLKNRIAELLELCGLEDAAKRRIAGFSKGMRQRLGLAQALIHRPQVLFLDEPTSALDPAGRRDVLNLIETLKGDTTVFLSSHILADVERVCDTIGVIQEGQLLLIEKRDSLLSRYASDVILLEFDIQNVVALDPFVSQIQSLSWVESVKRDGSVVRVTVSDRVQGKTTLLGIIAGSDLLLSRYEWVRPSLEEIFLAISS